MRQHPIGSFESEPSRTNRAPRESHRTLPPAALGKAGSSSKRLIRHGVALGALLALTELSEARAAHEYMEKSQMFGKIVLNP